MKAPYLLDMLAKLRLDRLREKRRSIPAPFGLPNVKDVAVKIQTDYKKTGKINFINLFGHCSSEQDILTVMSKAGYRHLGSYNIADDQSFNLFDRD